MFLENKFQNFIFFILICVHISGIRFKINNKMCSLCQLWVAEICFVKNFL